jgi:hypothetical protein
VTETTTVPTPHPSDESTSPATALVAEIAQLRARRAARDRTKVVIAAVGMVVGLVLTVVAYAKSATTDDVRVQNDAQILAVIGLTAAVIAGIAFLRYSLTEFLRYWLARALVQDADES